MKLMNKILFAALVMSLWACGDDKTEVTTDLIQNPKTAAGAPDLENLPVIEFKEERIEFGQITQGEKITREFEFKNVGKGPLVIHNVTAECGCTLAKDWPTEPIEPGGSGKFSVTYNSEGKQGQEVKKVTVEANTHPSATVVALAGFVIVPQK